MFFTVFHLGMLHNPNPNRSKVFLPEMLRNPNLKKRVFEIRLQKTHGKNEIRTRISGKKNPGYRE